jgi:tRNA(fMet)-specific endonuclease VapC
VLDTSTVILLPRFQDPMSLPTEPVITAVTLAELSGGPLVTEDEHERAARQAHLQQAEADFEPAPVRRGRCARVRSCRRVPAMRGPQDGCPSL